MVTTQKDGGSGAPLRRALRGRLRWTGLSCNTVVPAALLFGFLWADGVWTATVAARALLLIAVAAPLIAALMARVMGRILQPVYLALDLLARGERPDEAALDRARRMVFFHPWRAAGVSVVMWSLVFPLVMLLPSSYDRSGSPIAATEIILACVVVAPLLGTIALFAFEGALRPAVAALFPEGGVERYQTRYVLSVRRRVVYTTIFVGPLGQLLLALLVYRRVSDSATTQEALARLLPLEIFILLASFMVVQIHAWFLRSGLGEPMERLLAAMRSVRAGNLDVRVPVESADSLGVLSDAFNEMARGLRERANLQDAFRRYVSPEIETQARTGPISLGGELREVTVLFSDVRGFTSLSERMAPEAMVEMINRYFEVMVACVRAEGGTVNKFLGDGMMALFGAPAALPDAPLAAVRAALAMEDALFEFNADQARRGLPELAIGVGIATGPVVVGNVGSLDRLEYTAIGDVVNTASRIEGLTKDFGSTVLLDEATFEAVRGRVPIGMKGTFPVKGKSQPVPVYAPAVGTADVLPAVLEPLAWPQLSDASPS